MPIYMLLPNYPGSSKAERYPDWHEVYSFSWACSTPPGGKVNFTEFNVSLAPIRSSTKLMLLVASGKHLDRVVIAVVDGEGQERERYTLNTAVVSYLSQSCSSGETGPPFDSVGFNYSKITYRQWIQKDDGSFVYEQSAWDLSINAGT